MSPSPFCGRYRSCRRSDEDDYYPISRFEIPKDVVLEAGAFWLMPDGKLAVASRRGEVWMITDPFAKEVKATQFKRFCPWLHVSAGPG